MLGSTEIIVIAIVIIVLFGASAIPKFARSLGQAKKEFSAAMKEEEGAAKDSGDKSNTVTKS